MQQAHARHTSGDLPSIAKCETLVVCFSFQAQSEDSALGEQLMMAEKSPEDLSSWEEDDESRSHSAAYFDRCNSAATSSSQSQVSDSDVCNSGLPDLSGESGFSSLAVRLDSRLLLLPVLRAVTYRLWVSV